jgi:DNA-binding transcriptional ArsR family regulator
LVNFNSRLDETFFALADPTRRAILARLALGETTVSNLARPFPISLPAISRHLRVLEEARLLRRRKVGREHHCALDPAALREASVWIDEYRKFWTARLDSLERFLLARASPAVASPPPSDRTREPPVRNPDRRTKRRRP